MEKKVLTDLEKLRLMLRPPGKGLYTHSTGSGFASKLHRMAYGTDEPKKVHEAWEETLQKIRRAEVIVIGIPSDTGAGIMRGANFGPIGVREAYLKNFGGFPKGVLDIGDVLCIPQLLHDSMLSQEQIAASRQAVYSNSALSLPVSPLSILEDVLLSLHQLNSSMRPLIIGGDHSVSWPAMVYCHEEFGNEFGVLHFDAHTDLLENRLGVKYCFATWAYHAHKLIKPQHMVQVGIRTSAHTKEYWAQAVPVRQFWAEDVLGKEDFVLAAILQHFKKLGVRKIYISNDIDGTDMSLAPATGTPEANGLRSNFVLEMIAKIGKSFDVIGADLVEVAPPLSGLTNFEDEKTCQLAAEYLGVTLESMLRVAKA